MFEFLEGNENEKHVEEARRTMVLKILLFLFLEVLKYIAEYNLTGPEV